MNSDFDLIVTADDIIAMIPKIAHCLVEIQDIKDLGAHIQEMQVLHKEAFLLLMHNELQITYQGGCTTEEELLHSSLNGLVSALGESIRRFALQSRKRSL